MCLYSKIIPLFIYLSFPSIHLTVSLCPHIQQSTSIQLQRGVSTKRNELPPIVADLANSTLGELDGKLELLSNLQWKIDPFLRSEMGNAFVSIFMGLIR